LGYEKDTIHIQSDKARLKAINLFCAVTSVMACPYLFFLIYHKDYKSMGVMALIMLSFLTCILLNQWKFKTASRFLVVFVTNLSVLYFSCLLGMKSGIHLYLFTAPLIVYMLFDFKEKRRIVLTLMSYAFTFALICLQSRYRLFPDSPMDESTTHLFYILSFSFALFLSFVLIIYFAHNNAAYNTILQDRNEFLTVHQAALIGQIEERLVTEAKLKDSLEEKNVLLSEIHHRVKNNLAVVSGLLELQSMNTEDEKVIEVFTQSRNRIKSLALIHESVYQNENLSSIRFDRYFEQILQVIRNSYPSIGGEVLCNVEIGPIELEIARAIPCGLLLNEIVTNAFKHVFKSHVSGVLHISLTSESGLIHLMVRDNGPGLPETAKTNPGSLGMTLIDSFVKQLKGSLQIRNEHGAVFHITFKDK
jgi:two-component sensor histidine kinase